MPLCPSQRVLCTIPAGSVLSAGRVTPRANLSLSSLALPTGRGEASRVPPCLGSVRGRCARCWSFRRRLGPAELPHWGRAAPCAASLALPACERVTAGTEKGLLLSSRRLLLPACLFFSLSEKRKEKKKKPNGKPEHAVCKELLQLQGGARGISASSLPRILAVGWVSCPRFQDRCGESEPWMLLICIFT